MIKKCRYFTDSKANKNFGESDFDFWMELDLQMERVFVFHSGSQPKYAVPIRHWKFKPDLLVEWKAPNRI